MKENFIQKRKRIRKSIIKYSHSKRHDKTTLEDNSYVYDKNHDNYPSGVSKDILKKIVANIDVTEFYSSEKDLKSKNFRNTTHFESTQYNLTPNESDATSMDSDKIILNPKKKAIYSHHTIYNSEIKWFVMIAGTSFLSLYAYNFLALRKEGMSPAGITLELTCGAFKQIIFASFALSSIGVAYESINVKPLATSLDTSQENITLKASEIIKEVFGVKPTSQSSEEYATSDLKPEESYSIDTRKLGEFFP